MRDNFINALINLAKNDKDIVLLTGDLGFGVFEKFESSFPGQYFNVGVAEQNMIGLATGLALEGKKVVTYSIGNFGILSLYFFNGLFNLVRTQDLVLIFSKSIV